MAAVVCCGCNNNQEYVTAAWIDGEFVDGSVPRITATIYPNGATSSRKRVEVADGKFMVEVFDVDKFAHVDILAGDTYFGVKVVPGDTLSVVLTADPETEGAFTPSFKGKTETDSKTYSAIASTFNNYSPYYDKDTVAEALELLKANSADFYANTGAKLNKFYKKLASVCEKNIKAGLLAVRAYENDADPNSDEEFCAVMKEVDPNDPMYLSSDLVPMWASAEAYKLAPEGVDNLKAMMDVVSEKVTNPASKKLLVDNVAEMMFVYGEEYGVDNIDEFWEKFTSFASDYPEIIENYQDDYEAVKSMAKGNDAMDFTMETPDGKEVKLSDLFGKVLYIDVWATWCGPCRGEIPYLATLAEHYKGNSDVYVMSVSVDSTSEPWLEMITADKPAWPQYWVNRENDKNFSKDWKVTSIPRFIIIDKQGKIFNAYAQRPSNDKAIAQIDACAAM